MGQDPRVETPELNGLVVLNVLKKIKVGMNRSMQVSTPHYPKHGIHLSFLASGNLFWFLPSLFKVLFFSKRKLKFDFLLFNSTASVHPLWGRVGFLIFKFMAPRVPVVYFYWHETDWTLRQFKEGFPRAFEDLKAMVLHPKVSHLVASEAVSRSLKDFFGLTDTSPIYECSDLDVDKSSDTLNANQLGEISVVNMASVQARKGPDLFIETAKKVLKLRPETVFTWFGDGPEYEKYLDQMKSEGLQDKIQFRGFEWNRIPYLKRAKMLFLTSRDDPFPLAVLEALGFGKPVLAFDTGGAPEVLRSAGFVSPAFDTDKAAEQILTILGTQEDPAVVKSRAQLYVDQYSPAVFAERLGALIQQDYKELQLQPAENDNLVEKLFWGAKATFFVVVASAALRYVTHVALARWMEVTNYGLFTYINAWVELLSILASLGLGLAAVRYVPQYFEKEKFALLKGFMRFASTVTFAMSLLMVVVGAFLIANVMDVGKWGEHKGVLTLGFCLIPVFAMIKLYTEYSRGFGHVLLAYVPPLIIRQILMLIGGAAVFYWQGKLTAQNGVVVLFVTFLTILAIQIRGVYRAAPRKFMETPFLFHRSAWMAVAFPLLLISLFSYLLYQTDILMLGSMLTIDDVGMYGAASRTASLVSFPLFAVNAAVSPGISALFARKDRAGMQDIVVKACRWTFWPSLVISISLILLGKTILGLFGSSYVGSYDDLVVLSGGYLVASSFGVLMYILNVTGHQMISLKAYGLTIVLNVAMNYILIPKYGTVGAAISTVISLVALNVILYFVTNKALGVSSFLTSKRGAVDVAK